jgi:hypothetical protein
MLAAMLAQAAANGGATGAAAPANAVAPMLQVWELPAQADAASRDGWKAVEAGAAFRHGAALDNGRITLLAAVGSDVVQLLPSDRSLKAGAQIVPVAADGKGLGKIIGVKLAKREDDEAALTVSFQSAEVSVAIRLEQLAAVVTPGRGVGAIEVGGRTAYVVMPDFFGHDVVFNPRQLRSDLITPPAENFLLNLQAGGDAILMCVWQGPLALGKEKKGDEKEPRVDLVLAGQGAERMVTRTRHECDGKPLYVALLARKGLWFDKDISNDTAQKPMELDWARPYEAKWRALFLGREGAFSDDFLVRDVTWDITYDSDWGKNGRRDAAGYPQMWFQGLWIRFDLPAWIQDTTTKKTFACIYADYKYRAPVVKANEALRAKAKKDGTPFVEAYPTNVFNRLVVYAIDRRKETPLSEKTPTDVMRDCLGVGPCEYVVDLEGMSTDKSKTWRNGHYVHPTCFTCDAWILRFRDALKGNSILPEETRNGKKGVPLSMVKPGERFKPEDEAILVDRLEDLAWFTDKINKRLAEYNAFAKKMIACCNAAAAENPAVKPTADAVAKEAESLLKQCNDAMLKKVEEQHAKWDATIKGYVEEVKAGQYANFPKANSIRDYAVNQDDLMGVCHRLTKGMRQSAAMVDSSDPAVTAFAARVRAMSHDMLRSKGHFEF